MVAEEREGKKAASGTGRWAAVRGRKKGDIANREQGLMGPYVLDFYCAKARLAIEIDGLIHDQTEQAVKDDKRDAWMLEQGITTHRITGSDVMADPDETALGIWLLANDRAAELAGA